jgi:tetratricopeptide (TPR) repeat protein
VADAGATTRKPGWRYAVGAALCLAVVGGAYLYLYDGQAKPTEAQAPEAAKPTIAAAKQAVPDDEPPALSSIMIDQARELVGEARRLAASGDFEGAEIALEKAEQTAPGVDETAQARREIAELNTPQGQLAAQLERARNALDLGDNAVAEQAIAQAERLNAPASAIAELRASLQVAQQKDTHKDDHIASLLAEMRTAAARHDFASANRALNEAARIDIQNRDVLQARDELNREQASVRAPAKD